MQHDQLTGIEKLTTAGRAKWLLARLRIGDRRESWTVFAMMVSVFLVILLTTFMQVQLNQWWGSFYNSLQDRALAQFLHQLGLFFLIVFSLLGMGVAQTWITETMKVRSRRWLTTNVMGSWLMPRRAYLLGFAGDIARNPDQRISEDVRRISDQSIGLLVGLGQSTLLLLSFISVLWALSSQVVFTYGGESFTVPGYMVWCALIFTFIGSGLTYLVGRPLIAINAESYAREGAFRTLLVNINEHAEGISLDRGEPDARKAALCSLGSVIGIDQALANRRARLTWVTAGYGWVGLIAPTVLAAPGYFTGTMSLGELMMVVGAFVQVQNSLRWFIDHYPAIAEWQACLLRVTLLLEGLEALEAGGNSPDRIEYSFSKDGNLVLDRLAVCLPGAPATCTLIDHRQFEIAPGDRVLFVAPPGGGKTALFMSLAELWPWGKGSIQQPAPFNAMYISERPYIPQGSLRHAIAYPAPETQFTPCDIHSAMHEAGISHLVPQYDVSKHWGKDLSIGDQQRFAIARLLLHKPDWAVLDDSLSALDDQSHKEMLGIMHKRLPHAGIIFTSHRRNECGFFGRTIELRGAASPPPFTLVNAEAGLETAAA
jgi:putative ATP-binding cassette transporter